MKKILFFLGFIFTFFVKAQYAITATANPVVGDIDASIGTSTVGLAIPVSGTNKLWNYSGISLKPNSISTGTYVPFSSVPNNTLFPGGNIGISYDFGYFDVYKINNSTRDLLGSAESSTSNCLVLSDPITFLTLPFGYGNGYFDNFGFNNNGDVLSGAVSLLGNGTGTLMLPGSVTINNVLKITMNYTQTETTSTYSTSVSGVQHIFYASVSKFPLLTISTSTSSNSQSPNVNTFFDGWINKDFALGVGIEEHDLEPGFSVFPNPVNTENITLTFTAKNNSLDLSLINTLGQTIKEKAYSDLSLGENTISFNMKGLANGVYYLQIKSGEYQSVKKLVVE